MQLTYRYRLYPTKIQAEEIRRTCNAVRFLYNQLLEDRTETFRQTGKWARFTTEKYKVLSWMMNIDHFALQAAENQLKNAYDHFFYILRTKKDVYRQEALERAEKDKKYQLMDTDLVSYPRFKRKKTTAESYQTNPSTLQIKSNTVWLPFIGFVKAKFHRSLPKDAQIQKCTVLKKRSGRFYLLLLLEIPDKREEKQFDRPMGVVFSPGCLVQRSDGAPVSFQHMEPDLKKRINRAYKTLKRRTPGSKRYEKQREYLAKLYEKRVEQRKDALHKAARQIANDADVLCMEAPEVLARTPELKRDGLWETVHDEAWWKFSHLVEHKMKAQGSFFWRVPRKHAFFGMCSCCGYVQKPVLTGESFVCSGCGKNLNRMENALQVLYQQAQKHALQMART